MNKTQTVMPRRGFLLSLGLGGLATAAALLAGRQARVESAPAAEPESAQGYRASEHVKRYYRSTRI